MNEAPRQPAVPPALGGFGEFALEQFPFAAAAAIAALESVAPPADRRLDAQAIDDLRRPFATALEQQLSHLAPAGLGDTTPRVAAGRPLRASRSRRFATRATASCAARRSGRR